MVQADCCKNSSFTRDRRSKKLYCSGHYTELIETRVKKTINRYKMLNLEDNIGVGYSGGKDSTVLLHILSKITTKYSNCEITALTVDEGIEGYRDGFLDLAKKTTRKYNINHVVVSFEEIFGATLDKIVEEYSNTKENLSPCALCGILRRRALNYAARISNATKIATAHNLDDEAQTILLNLLRGDLKKFIRLSREPFQKYKSLLPRIRPLVQVTEPEIVLYSYANNLDYHSNPCPYSSSAMRNDVREYLSKMEEKRPSTLINIVNLHDSLTPYFPKSSILNQPSKCQKCGEVATRTICPVCQIIEKLGIVNQEEK